MTENSPRGDTPDAGSLVRLAGPAAVLAGVMIVASQLTLLPLERPAGPATLTSTTYVVAMGVYVVAFWVLMIALVGAYLRQASRAGRFGLIALCAAVIGTMDMAGNMWFDAFVGPWLADVMPAVLDAPRNGTLVVGGFSSYVLMALGWVLFGIASFRAGVFPRTVSASLIVCGVLAFRALPPFSIPIGLAVGALGVWLIMDAGEGTSRDPVEPLAARPTR
jgi:hypothetical protein